MSKKHTLQNLIVARKKNSTTGYIADLRNIFYDKQAWPKYD